MAAAFMPVHALLEQSADRTPAAVAVVHGEAAWTYAQVEALANRVAGALLERGLTHGQRVGLLADNGIDYIAGFFGILKAGGCAVALSGANKAATNNLLLARAEAVALVTRAANVRRDLPEVVADLPHLTTVIVDRANPAWTLPETVALMTAADLESVAADRPAGNFTPGDLCALLFTSGSTGTPNGVTLTHGNLAANTSQIQAYLNLTADDRIMVVLPFHYSFGNSLLLTHFAVGGRVVIDNRFAYPATVLETMESQKVTGFSGVPSTYAILCAKTDFLDRDFPHLRYLTQAGGGMTPALIRRIHTAFENRAEVVIMYGQTEASARLSYVPPARLAEKIGSIGVAIPGVTLSLLRTDGTACGVDEVGEVVAEGDNIMRGYWEDPGETALVLKEGRLHTGDLGRRDADGFIWLVDRIKNMIKVGANRVSSREVEDTIAEIEGVIEVCVVGVPDEILGEAMEAHLVVAPGLELSEQKILAFLHEKLAMFKIPRKVHYHKELPKNSSGKILAVDLKNIK